MAGRPQNASPENQERTSASRTALIVHPDLEVLSSFQDAFRKSRTTVHVARELPTALLAVAQNDFDLCLVCSRLHEPGDGWTLGGVLRRLFPGAFVAVLAESNVASLQQAINNGFDQLYDVEERSPGKIAAAALWQAAREAVQ
jgi:DNA-binding NtrC family response regulator